MGKAEDVQEMITNLIRTEKLRAKIMKKMELEVDKGDIDTARSWGHLLTMLPD